jgi:hypothetical protein
MSLQNLQADFLDSIFTGVSDNLVHPDENLRIYENNIHSNLVNALSDTYPLIRQLLGENFFAVAARDYIAQYPSRSPNLHEYGEYFSDFIDNFAPANDFVYLAEVADFEWACHEIYFSAEHAAFDIKQLNQFSPDEYENLHFILNPASKMMQFAYPILDIVDLCKNNRTNNVDLDNGGVNLQIIKRDMELQLSLLTDADYVFLSALNNHQPLKSAVEAALDIDAAFNLNEKLPVWIKDQTIVDCELLESEISE